MSDSKIQWTDKVWNVTRGCARVSRGCGDGTGGGCYAERQAIRMSGPGGHYEGLVRSTATGPRWTGNVRFAREKLSEPLHWQKPRRVFVASMSDPFHDGFSNEEIAALFGVMAACPQHQFQVLTKRPLRMRDWFRWIADQGEDLQASVGEAPPSGSPVPAACALLATEPARLPPAAFNKAAHAPWPLPNVWIGVSVEDQVTAEERIPFLLEVPAAVRFVSYEPALGPVDFTRLQIVAPRPPHGPGAYLDALRGHVIGPDDMDALLESAEISNRLWAAMEGLDRLAGQAVISDTSDLPAVRAAIQRLEVAAEELVERAQEFRAALHGALAGPPTRQDDLAYAAAKVRTIDLMRRALWSLVAGEARKRRARGSLWSRVERLCGLGSTTAAALCRELGFDPETGATLRERGWETAP